MPIVDEKAPRECDFDAMLNVLKGTDLSTACVFNCQVILKIGGQDAFSFSKCYF